ncbi:MAG: hypothetical protein ACRCXD_17170, partial [Luteolibacter sp.]
TGGFARYSITGVGAASSAAPPPGLFESYIPAISIAANADLRPLAESLIAEVDPSRGGAYTLRPFFKPDGLRSPVSLSFTALGSDDPFTLDSLEVRGDIVMRGGASIVTEPGASVSFRAGTITLLGSVTAPGGNVSIAGAGAFPLTATQRATVFNALSTVHLGSSTRLSVAGTTILTPDVYGRRVGSVLDGGNISISGNILAEKGGVLDVSGSSGILDLSSSVLAGSGNRPLYLVCGINIPPCNTRGTVATRLDSGGGSIDIKGSQMLLSDATLVGGAGGSTAAGGTLSVGSGQFIVPGGISTTADTNLIISQSSDVILDPNGMVGIGLAPTDSTGATYGNLGFFSLDRFHGGSFSSLILDGNLEFRSAVDLHVPGSLRLASGGVIRSENAVSIRANYLHVGQDFRAPENPEDSPFQPFSGGANLGFNFPPRFGTGTLSLDATLIDLGTLSLQNVGRAAFTANGGDIRGNGTLSMAGDLTLTAARIYPTSLASFQIFAYDHAQGSGSVSIRSSGGGGENPISAGGHLAVYSSVINQYGVLNAPLGSISLGWDGIDLDPSDPDLDAPFDIIARAGIAAPITGRLTLGGGSITSVAGPSSRGDSNWLAPFGINPDGQSWIDPRGVNVNLNGLPEKVVSISAGNVNMESGATVDIRGGGDLLASRWVAGNGGSIDLLGSASAAWAGGNEYEPGDLVSFGGETWSARVRHQGQSPTISTYWSKVAESFAIIPSSG